MELQVVAGSKTFRYYVILPDGRKVTVTVTIPPK